MAKKLTANKAKEILTDGSVHGKPLTLKQKRFFGAIAGGAPVKAQKGKKVIIDGWEYNTSDPAYAEIYKSGYNPEGKGSIGYFDKEGRLITSKTTLPEVVISKKDKDTKKFYDELSDSERYAFDQMTKKYGPVNITKNKGKGLFEGTAGHYNPFTNTITINPRGDSDYDYKTYLAELAHKVQFDKQGKFDVIGDWTFNDLPDYIKNSYYKIKDKYNIGDSDENFEGIVNSSPYLDPSTVEYEAHSVYEPQLEDEFLDYKYDDIKGRNYNKFKSGGWLDKYEYGGEAGYTDVPFNYNSAWGGQFQLGGNVYPVNYTPQAQDGISFLPQQDPEMMYEDRYNTPLNKKEQKEFAQWAAKESKRRGRNILMDKGAYDVQGFWKSGDYKKTDKDGHGTDTWKKPNHPTFSNQSKYHGVDGFYGGNWNPDGGYQPSKQTADMYGPSYYSWLFGREPERPEHLDASRFRSGANAPSPLYYAMGGSLPGSVGFTYARTGGIPSNGKYAKKTKASAQTGETVSQDTTAYQTLPEVVVNSTTDPDVEQAKQKMIDFYENRPSNLSGKKAVKNISRVEFKKGDPEALKKADYLAYSQQEGNRTPFIVYNPDLGAYEESGGNIDESLQHELSHVGFYKLPNLEKLKIHPVSPKEFARRWSFKNEGDKIVPISKGDAMYYTRPNEIYARRKGASDFFGLDMSKPVPDEEFDKMIKLRQALDPSLTEEQYQELIKKYPKLGEEVERLKATPGGNNILNFLNALPDDVKKYRNIFNEVTAVPGEQAPIAQNGMIYYQHGLDWKPKTISRDGSDIPKNQNAKYTLPNARDLARQMVGSNESTSLGTKIDEAALRQASIDRQRRNQGSIRQAGPERSAASKALAIATHPMTALAYKVKGQDIPENFDRGEKNIYETAVNIVNPFSYIDQARQVKEDIGQGNYLAAGIGALGLVPGEGAFERGAGKFLHNKKGITLDDFESAINYHLGEGLGIKKNPSNLKVKVRPGDIYPEVHGAENAPKFTVDLYNEGRHSGFIGLDKLNTADYDIPGKKGTLYTKVADYPYAFSKLGEDALKGSGISGEVNKALTNALQEYDLGKLYSSTVHTDEGLARWKNLVNKGKAKEVAPNRFELYKKGGVIKDDMGQWAHPGEVTEIGSNQITMQGVPYPVLGISDTGDTQMMYPEQEYKFKGKKVTEYPMAQTGRIQPSSADSAALYNNTMALLNYYGNKKKYKNQGVYPVPYDVTNLNMSSMKDMQKRLKDPKQHPFTARRWNSNLNVAGSLIGALAGVDIETDQLDPDYDFKMSDYYQRLSPYQYKQRETANNILDTDAPMGLYDTRIKPTREYNYLNIDDRYGPIAGTNPLYGDIVSFYGYDPALIKPWNMLTDKEKVLRSGKPNQSSITIVNKKSNPVPNKPQVSNSKTTSSTTIQKTQPKPKYWTAKDIPTEVWNKFIKEHPGAIGMDPSHVDKNNQHMPVYPSKSEPSLKKKVSKMEPISTKKSSSPSLRMPNIPNVELPGVQMGDYEVSYYSPESKDWANRRFTSQEESDRFAQEMSQRGYPGSYGNVTQTKKTNKKSTGGWLDKYN